MRGRAAGRIGLVAACVIGAARPACAGLYDALTETAPTQPSDVIKVQENPYAAVVMQPVDKLTRGFINLMTGALEIPRTIGGTAHTRGWRQGLTSGVVDGFKRTGIRTYAGVHDIVTFPAPPYRHLFLTPEFAAGESSLYRGLPAEIVWEAVEPPGPPLPNGPLAAPITVLTAPIAFSTDLDR